MLTISEISQICEIKIMSPGTTVIIFYYYYQITITEFK